MPDDRRLPIKVVIPRSEDIVPYSGGGGDRKLFVPVTSRLRREVSGQINGVREYFTPSFRRNLPAVARITLRRDALAKSHRPLGLLKKTQCRVIGVQKFGELLVSVNPRTLDNLAEVVRSDGTKSGEADISTIENVRPYTPQDAIGAPGIDGLRRRLEASSGKIKLRLFVHHDRGVDQSLRAALQAETQRLGLQAEPVTYGTHGRVYRLQGVHGAHIEALAHFVGTRNLGTFATYRVLRTSSIPVRAAVPDDFPAPTTNGEYPLLGIIDSGINPADPYLAPWVVHRQEYLPVQFRNYSHGTFVAGLAVHARQLNNGDPRLPESSALLVDAIAVPEEGISDDDLVTIMEDLLRRYPQVRVWGLSLAHDEPCEDQAFSDLGVALDRLQQKHNVLFVTPAGNYNRPPFRNWPPNVLNGEDKISSPADSVLSITVASLAHLDNANSCVRREQPSPFSRRGPGPAHLPKPEVAHYGGNCDPRGTYAQIGMLSLNGAGSVAEDIGTSFAVPLVASLTANVYQQLVTPAERSLVKALIVHSAAIGSDSITAESLRYRGFGVPGDIPQILTCTPSAATLIFEPEVSSGMTFERWPFPIPSCLRGTGAEIVMTLCYDPPLDETYGAEYCRRNVDASLGTYDEDAHGKRHHHGKVPPEPTDIRRRYERYLIEQGFKWSPIKVYRKRFSHLGGTDWRLMVSVHNRAEYINNDPQKIALIITISDPEKDKPVYDEIVAAMVAEQWNTIDLQIRDRVRLRIG